MCDALAVRTKRRRAAAAVSSEHERAAAADDESPEHGRSCQRRPRAEAPRVEATANQPVRDSERDVNFALMDDDDAPLLILRPPHVQPSLAPPDAAAPAGPIAPNSAHALSAQRAAVASADRGENHEPTTAAANDRVEPEPLVPDRSDRRAPLSPPFIPKCRRTREVRTLPREMRAFAVARHSNQSAVLQWLLWLLRQASGLTDSLSALETVGPNPRRKHPPLALKGAHFMITGVNVLTAHGY